MKESPLRPDLLRLSVAFVLLLIGCGHAAAQTEPQSVPVLHSERGVEKLNHGLDVSAHSGRVDWKALVAAGHTFAFVKATEGVDLKDSAFEEHWRGMKAAGIVRGAYHFYVTEDDPEEQARFFLSTVSLEPGDLAPVVDVELIGKNTAGGLAGRIRKFLDIVREQVGVMPIVYTTARFWNEHVGDGFGAYPLWIAEYEVETPRIPSGWRTWHLWQWQENAPVVGVEKGADLSRVNRDGADLGPLLVPGRHEKQ